MDRNELEKALKDNGFTKTKISAAEVANIMRYVNVELKLEKYSLDYYYEIDVEELLSSMMPSVDLEDLKNKGWFFNENKEKIILFIT